MGSLSSVVLARFGASGVRPLISGLLPHGGSILYAFSVVFLASVSFSFYAVWVLPSFKVLFGGVLRPIRPTLLTISTGNFLFSVVSNRGGCFNAVAGFSVYELVLL